MTYPRQHTAPDEHGVTRFKANAIVQYLLDNGPFDMNHLAVQDFSDEDRCQFAQLIGYSESGYETLSYVEAFEGARTFDIDELPTGVYTAYVSGYRDEGLVGFYLQAEGDGTVNLKKHYPFTHDQEDSLFAESSMMPVWDKTITGGMVIELEILESGGYKVLKILR